MNSNGNFCTLIGALFTSKVSYGMWIWPSVINYIIYLVITAFGIE